MARLRSTSRKHTPLSPPKAPSPAVVPDAPSQNKQRTRSSSRDLTTAQQQQQQQPNIETVLATVDEEQPVSERSDFVNDNDSSGLEASSSGSSLQELLDALDRDTIIDDLQILYDDSTTLISLFENVDDDTLRDLCAAPSQPDSAMRRRFQAKAKRLRNTRAAYGTNHYGGNLDFISPDLIVRKIVGERGPEAIRGGQWRPDGVLFLANLALQVIKLLSPSEDVHRSYLEEMFNNFPHQFMDLGHFLPSHEVYQGLCDLHVEILTQLYLDQVELELGQPDFDPDTVLGNVFFDEDGRVKGSSDPYSMSKALERGELIRGFFDSNSGTFVDFQSLKERFPWTDFVVQAAKWSVARKNELEKLIASRGGIDQLADLLLAGNFEDDTAEAEQDVAELWPPTESNQAQQHPEGHGEHDDFDKVNVQAEEDDAETASVRMNAQKLDRQTDGLQAGKPEDRNTGNMRSAQNPAAGPLKEKKYRKVNANRLKTLKAQFAARTSGADPKLVTEDEFQSSQEIAQSPTPVAANEGWSEVMDEEQAPNADEDADQPQDHAQAQIPDEEIVATQQTNIVLQTVRRQNEQSNKENARATAKKASFLDRQEGAERVSWTETFGDEDHSPPRQRPSKRSVDQAHDESDEDDAEFQTDKRAVKRPRTAIAERSKQPSATTRKRFPNIEEDAEETNGGAVRQARTQTLTSQLREEPSRTARAEPTVSPKRPRRTFPFSSSQPVQSSTQRTESSRGILQPISSSNRGLPSSSAPTRSNPTTHTSSLPAPRHPSSSHQAPPRASSRLPSPSQEPPGSQVAQVNREAKQRVQMSRDLMQNRQAVQTRKAYSVEEVDRLMEMVEIYGAKWARILQADHGHDDGPVLQGRNQVQLKDKARTIKMDFLKAGRRLPRGFESVSVGNRRIEELRLLNIDYIEGENAGRYIGPEGGDDDDDDDQVEE